jgi:hypothetical protein
MLVVYVYWNEFERYIWYLRVIVNQSQPILMSSTAMGIFRKAVVHN